MQERNSRACTAPPRQPLTSAGLRSPPLHVEPKQSPQWGFRLWLPLVSPLPPLQEARGSVVGSASSALGGRYAVLVSCGCCNKSPLTRGFRTSSLWSYSSGGQKSGGEAPALTSRCWQGGVPLESQGRIVPRLLQLLGSPTFLGSWPHRSPAKSLVITWDPAR